MPSKSFYAPVLLNDPMFRGLKTETPSVNQWFTDWGECVAQGDPRKLINLLHWGLQDALFQGSGHEIGNIICHYLAVADGHSSRENFGYVPGNFSNLSNYKYSDQLKQEISDKAWMELCNRVFTFNESGENGGLTYWLRFAEPHVAQAFVSFIQPYRWKAGDDHVHCPNINPHKDCAYHRKAGAFAKQFLKNAWDYKHIRLLYRGKAELEGKSWNDWTFFLGLRPKLIELMNYYGILDYLYDKKLDSKSRKKLRRTAYTSSVVDHPKVPADAPNLQELYGQCNPEHGCLVFINRTAARIVLTYPLLVAGRKQYVKAIVAKKKKEKAEQAQKLEEQLRGIEDKLKKLK